MAATFVGDEEVSVRREVSTTGTVGVEREKVGAGRKKEEKKKRRRREGGTREKRFEFKKIVLIKKYKLTIMPLKLDGKRWNCWSGCKLTIFIKFRG